MLPRPTEKPIWARMYCSLLFQAVVSCWAQLLLLPSLAALPRQPHSKHSACSPRGSSRASRSATDSVTAHCCARAGSPCCSSALGPWVAQPCFPARGEGGTCCRQLLLIQGPLKNQKSRRGFADHTRQVGSPSGHDPVNSLSHTQKLVSGLELQAFFLPSSPVRPLRASRSAPQFPHGPSQRSIIRNACLMEGVTPYTKPK